MNLALIIELCLVQAAESRQTQLTLRLVREELLSKDYNCRIENPSVDLESQAVEKSAAAPETRGSNRPAAIGALSHALDLLGIEILNRKP